MLTATLTPPLDPLPDFFPGYVAAVLLASLGLAVLWEITRRHKDAGDAEDMRQHLIKTHGGEL